MAKAQIKTSEPSMGFLQKRFGPTFMQKKKTGDVALPNESGRTDSRLKPKFNFQSKKKEVEDGYEGARKLFGKMKK